MDILVMVLDRIGCNIHHNCTRIDYTDEHYVLYEQNGSKTILNKKKYMLIILRD